MIVEVKTYKVEGAVDLVKLCAENGGEEVGHCRDAGGSWRYVMMGQAKLGKI